MLLFVTVALNTGLIGCYLLRPLLQSLRRLRAGLERGMRYLRCCHGEARERAFRRRVLLLARTLAGVLGQLLLIALSFAPSLALAHYQSHWSNALLAAEAIAGTLAAAIFCAWRLARR